MLFMDVAWGLPEKLNWLKSVALILVTIYLTSQYKITSLTWFGDWDSLSLWFVVTTNWTDSFYSTILSVVLHYLLFSFITAQILAETHPSVHGSSFLAHDPFTVGTFPVPPDPAGKVSTYLFLIVFLKSSQHLHESKAVKRHFT